MAGPHPTRRRLLAAAGVTSTVALAGCSTLPWSGSNEEREYQRLARSAVYVGDGVDLSMPDEVATVGSPRDADVLVLPGDTDSPADRAVGWLADGLVVGLVGEGAEDTWLGWQRSDVYRDRFGREGFAASDPDPQLLVAALEEGHVTTYRHTWSDGPRDVDVLAELDEILVHLAKTPTPG